ncbi:small, acid-soluble spore protein, alpha/beta type [Fictibacillus iocasae]|uniref:Small, acid-soluble spore protein, alpha/beta type n=1 Tax=Fictibacillus iocasae TaxID=2715437 RepID=A0ABW2NTY3_9BACL
MAKRRRPIVPEARDALDRFKAEVMKNAGYNVDLSNPNTVKYEVAKDAGIPLKDDGNGGLTAKEAGIIGGEIGGRMVRELIRRAKENL